MQLLKTCWIREELANYDNIDLLWFNFIESSKRYITPEKASEIKTPFSTLRVWVFWKPSPLRGEGVKWENISKWDLVDIIMIARKAKINAIQIHWICDFAYLKLYNYLVIRSVGISHFKIPHPSGAPFDSKESKENNIDFYIIDWENPWSWEWYNYEEINKLNFDKKFLVAGWVSEKNVREIYKIFENNENFCWVDIASWVDNGDNICLEKVGRIIYEIEKSGTGTQIN